MLGNLTLSCPDLSLADAVIADFISTKVFSILVILVIGKKYQNTVTTIARLIFSYVISYLRNLALFFLIFLSQNFL